MRRPRPKTEMKHAAAACTLALLTIAFTWPVARELNAGLPADPRGVYQRACDPQLETWTLDWDYRWLSGSAPAGAWNAPIFHPEPDTLTYSEHLFGAALLLAPLAPFIEEPITRYNVLFVASFFLSALAA